MRFMVIVKVKNSDGYEAGELPSQKLLSDMGKFNEELVKAGVMEAGEGLQPSRKGARVHFKAGKPSVTDGPFAEAKELVGGFWIWKVVSKAEAIQWAKRIPFTGDEEVEIRQVSSPEDFAPNMTEEMQERERRLSESLRKNK
jgi:hypothetical protein